MIGANLFQIGRMQVEWRDKGIHLVQQAIAADERGDTSNALQLYTQCIEYLLLYLKWEKNPDTAKMFRERLQQYVERAEQLKEPAKDAFEKSLESVIITTKPNVRWDDVAGLDAAKSALKQAAILPLKFPNLFQDMKPWKGILLYGPPGTGKSHLARALATEANTTFLSVTASDLTSKWVGDSERLVRALFEMARKRKPCVVFIDEVESMCGSREGPDGASENGMRMKTEFLAQTDGVGKDMDGVLLLGATNLPWKLDVGMRRRFERRIYIPLPDASARARLFQMCNKLTDAQCAKLARRTDGFSGADVSVCIKDALMQRVRVVQDATHFKAEGETLVPCSPGDENAIEMTWEQVERLGAMPVTFKDFGRAVETTKPSVSNADLVRYDEWTKEFGIEGN